MKNIVSPAELRVLALVEMGRTGPEIAAHYRKEAGRKIAHGTLYAALRRLRSRGLVFDREEPGLDGRVKVFKATPDGFSVLATSRAYYARLGLFGQLTEGATS